MLSLMLAGGAVTRVVSGFVADYIGGVRTLLIGSLLQGMALLFYLPFDGLMSLYVISLMFGLAQGGIVPSYAIIVREYMPAKVAAERVGFLIMMTIFGMASRRLVVGLDLRCGGILSDCVPARYRVERAECWDHGHDPIPIKGTEDSDSLI